MTELDELIARVNRNMPPATRLLEGRVVAAEIAARRVDMTFRMKSEYCRNMGLQSYRQTVAAARPKRRVCGAFLY